MNMIASFAIFLSLEVFSTLVHDVTGQVDAPRVRGFDEYGARPARNARESGTVAIIPTREDRFPLTSVRTVDGSDREDDKGAAHTPFIRLSSTTSYKDGKAEMDNTKPNPRTISNVMVAQTGSMPNARMLSDMIWSWGQFIDHDMSLSEQSDSFGAADIPIPKDPTDPFSQKCSVIEFSRSDFILDNSSVRQQLNVITSFLDASIVYGSDEDRADALRSHVGGKLNTTVNGLLPPLNDGPVRFANAGGKSPDFFLCGDVRCNEQLGLLALHTLFVREHNRLCDRIKQRFKGKSDEDTYQLARKIVAAQVQLITYKEFLPALIGPMAPSLSSYQGYKPAYDPSISNEFSTGIFRFGHSLVSNIVGSVPMMDAFFDVHFYKANPINVGLILNGILSNQAQELDSQIVEDLRSFLFGNPSGGSCLDLASLNLQRARDHGIPSLNAFRLDFGLPAYTTFDQITSDVTLQTKLAAAYNNTIDEVDLWPGALSEDHVPGASVGQTLGLVMKHQFENLMHGDPHFFLGDKDLKSPALAGIFNPYTFSFSDVLRNNLGGSISQQTANNPFFV